MTNNISKEAEQTLAKLQVQNQQLETLLIQKQSLMVEKNEIEMALKELEKNETDEVYKIVGPILVKVTLPKIKKDLEETKEEIDIRLKSIEKNENKLRESIEKARNKLRELLPMLQGETSPAA
jgi:prefoldin beta subunit